MQNLSVNLSRSSGFSLLELMIVVAILGIGVALAVPSFESTFANNRLRKAVVSFHQAATTAKSEAVQRGEPVNLTPISGGWANGWRVQLTNGDVLAEFDPPKRITLSSSSSSLGQMTFDENGQRIDHRLATPTNPLTFEVRFCDYRKEGRLLDVRITGTRSDIQIFNGCS